MYSNSDYCLLFAADWFVVWPVLQLALLAAVPLFPAAGAALASRPPAHHTTVPPQPRPLTLPRQPLHHLQAVQVRHPVRPPPHHLPLCLHEPRPLLSRQLVPLSLLLLGQPIPAVIMKTKKN